MATIGIYMYEDDPTKIMEDSVVSKSLFVSEGKNHSIYIMLRECNQTMNSTQPTKAG